MYLDGLEIAGLGAGMVFLALVVMFGATLGLRLVIGRVGDVRLGRARAEVSPPPISIEGPPPAFTPATLEDSAPTQPEARDKAARAAAIAVALYLTEEEEAEGRPDR